MIILVDMDNTIADFEGRFLEIWQERYPHIPAVPREARRHFYQTRDYPPEHAKKVTSVIAHPDFFCQLPPITGAVDALHRMVELGHDVFLCTSSYFNYPQCVSCKYRWVHEHLGQGWQRRVIITADKTVVRGDFLVDDRPELKGKFTPTWEYILYDQPYNREARQWRRLTWANWEDVLLGGA
jgi:5'-nucleotidase